MRGPLPNALVQLQAQDYHCDEAHPKSACQLQRLLGSGGRTFTIRVGVRREASHRAD